MSIQNAYPECCHNSFNESEVAVTTYLEFIWQHKHIKGDLTCLDLSRV